MPLFSMKGHFCAAEFSQGNSYLYKDFYSVYW
jgi:hypothetical protein